MMAGLPKSLCFLIPHKQILASSTNESELVKGLSRAETPDSFTRNRLPIPGSLLANIESQQPATLAVGKLAKRVGEKHKSTSQPEKKAGNKVANFQKDCSFVGAG
jgi:hypothetical protein